MGGQATRGTRSLPSQMILLASHAEEVSRIARTECNYTLALLPKRRECESLSAALSFLESLLLWAGAAGSLPEQNFPPREQ